MVACAQVPVLFTGTLRFNLTPFGEHSDAECWAALRRAHLAAAAEASPLGLDLVLREGGAPLSAGQKQLVALARALLRHAKVRWRGFQSSYEALAWTWCCARAGRP